MYISSSLCTHYCTFLLCRLPLTRFQYLNIYIINSCPVLMHSNQILTMCTVKGGRAVGRDLRNDIRLPEGDTINDRVYNANNSRCVRRQSIQRDTMNGSSFEAETRDEGRRIPSLVTTFKINVGFNPTMIRLDSCQQECYSSPHPGPNPPLLRVSAMSILRSCHEPIARSSPRGFAQKSGHRGAL